MYSTWERVNNIRQQAVPLQTRTQATESRGHAEPPTGSFNKTLTDWLNN